MNILSLFDGMSCGQQALNRCGFKVTNYFASEIDKHAIKVTQHNYPNTIQLGSVVNVDGYSLPKIDLLLGGSPCQSFSFAGKRKGMSTKDEQEILTLEHYLQLKQEGFEFEGQSYLFWEYMRLLNELRTKNPNVYFLLENVEMGEKWELVLSRAIGVKGIHINSALVSAQNRKRIYWTNIGMKPAGLFGDLESIIEQPKDKGILLKDILESQVDEKYFLSEKAIIRCQRKKNDTITKNKSACLVAGYARMGGRDEQLIVHNTQPRSGDPKKGGTGHLTRNDGKTYCLDTNQSNAVEVINQVGCVKFGRTEEAKQIRKQHMANGVDFTPFSNKEIVGLDFDKMNTLTTASNKDNLVMQINPSKESGGKQPYQQNRIYHTEEIKTLTNTVKVIATQLGNSTEFNNFINDKGKLYTLRKNEPNGVILREIIPMDFRFDEGFRPRENGKSPTLCLGSENGLSGNALAMINSRIRRLTPIECERLQTVEDNYTNCVSDSQRYKMLGNGWTIDVICHILNYLKNE